MRKLFLTIGLTMLGLMGAAAERAQAAPFVLTFSGTFVGATLNGFPLGALTPFVMNATFDSTTFLSPGTPTQSMYPASASFDIQGFGHFVTAPGIDFNVQLGNFGPGGPYWAGPVESNLTFGWLGFFDDQTPFFDSNAPVDSVYSNFTNYLPGPFHFLLDGGAGVLAGVNFAGGATASISAVPMAIPEPATLCLFGIALAALGLLRRPRGA